MSTEHCVVMNKPIQAVSTGRLFTFGVNTCTVIVLHDTSSGVATMVHCSDADKYGGATYLIEKALAEIKARGVSNVKAGLIAGHAYWEGDEHFRDARMALERGLISEETFSLVTFPHLFYSAYGHLRGKGIERVRIQCGILKMNNKVVYDLDKADFDPPLNQSSYVMVI